MSAVNSPRFTRIQERCYHHCFVDPDFGFEANSPAPPAITFAPIPKALLALATLLSTSSSIVTCHDRRLPRYVSFLHNVEHFAVYSICGFGYVSGFPDRVCTWRRSVCLFVCLGGGVLALMVKSKYRPRRACLCWCGSSARWCHWGHSRRQTGRVWWLSLLPWCLLAGDAGWIASHLSCIWRVFLPRFTEGINEHGWKHGAEKCS